jgi:hypothetical protein
LKKRIIIEKTIVRRRLFVSHLLNDINAMNAFGRQLLSENRNALRTFDQAAQAIVARIHRAFLTETGAPLFALVRIFRFSRADQVPSAWQIAAEPHDVLLSLAGSYGDLPEWCHPEQSKHHKVISLSTQMTAMMREAFRQLGIQPQLVAQGEPVQQVMSADLRRFYVPEALNSPFIPDQEQFVKPYGIRSVVGVGSQFVSGSAYMLIAFSKVFISDAQSWNFTALAPFTATLLAIYDAKEPLWSF